MECNNYKLSLYVVFWAQKVFNIDCENFMDLLINVGGVGYLVNDTCANLGF